MCVHYFHVDVSCISYCILLFVFGVVLTGNCYLKLVIVYLYHVSIQQTRVILTHGDFQCLNMSVAFSNLL